MEFDSIFWTKNDILRTYSTDDLVLNLPSLFSFYKSIYINPWILIFPLWHSRLNSAKANKNTLRQTEYCWGIKAMTNMIRHCSLFASTCHRMCVYVGWANSCYWSEICLDETSNVGLPQSLCWPVAFKNLDQADNISFVFLHVIQLLLNTLHRTLVLEHRSKHT